MIIAVIILLLFLYIRSRLPVPDETKEPVWECEFLHHKIKQRISRCNSIDETDVVFKSELAEFKKRFGRRVNKKVLGLFLAEMWAHYYNKKVSFKSDGR